MRPENKINRNNVGDRQRNLDENLNVPPIEDGNTPAGMPAQGYIYNSLMPSQPDSGYADAYIGPVSISTDKERTGNDSYYNMSVNYTITDTVAGTAGWYGTNILKAGDPFILRSYSCKNPVEQIFSNWVSSFGNQVITPEDVDNALNLGSNNFPLQDYDCTFCVTDCSEVLDLTGFESRVGVSSGVIEYAKWAESFINALGYQSTSCCPNFFGSVLSLQNLYLANENLVINDKCCISYFGGLDEFYSALSVFANNQPVMYKLFCGCDNITFFSTVERFAQYSEIINT